VLSTAFPYDDVDGYSSVTINGFTQTHSIAEQPEFDLPANSSGRIYVYLGSAGTKSIHRHARTTHPVGWPLEIAPPSTLSLSFPRTSSISAISDESLRSRSELHCSVSSRDVFLAGGGAIESGLASPPHCF
jgi:hypothetical protein